MASLTLQLPEYLRERVEPFSRWLPAILELSLLTLRTPAHRAVGELIAFLASNPSPREVHRYRLPEATQRRVDDLLEQNRAGTLDPEAAEELDEYLRLEHAVRLIKASLADEPASV